MRKFFNVLFVVGLSLFATSAFAGNVYLSGSGGLTILQDADNTATGFTGSTASFDNGGNAGVAIGYDFGSFRTEFEIAYRENDFDKIEFVTVPFPASGKISAASYLFNGAYDFKNSSSFTPYVEGGIGVAVVRLDNVEVPGVVFVDDSDSVLAYKIGLGTSYKVNPLLDLTIGYHYFGTKDPKFTNSAGVTFVSEYRSHNINAGVRFNF